MAMTDTRAGTIGRVREKPRLEPTRSPRERCRRRDWTPTRPRPGAPAAAAAAGLDEVGAAQDKIAPTTTISTEVRNQALTWGLLEAVRLKGVEVDQLAPTVSVSVQGYATAISQLREIAAAAAAAQSAAARAASASVASAQSAQAKINQLRAGAII